jgi:hypothetical protein
MGIAAARASAARAARPRESLQALGIICQGPVFFGDKRCGKLWWDSIVIAGLALYLLSKGVLARNHALNLLGRCQKLMQCQ